MITVLCPHPAWDVTYRLAPEVTLTPGRTHRVAGVHERLGGKGVNVARVLSALGEPVRLVLPALASPDAAVTGELAGLATTGVDVVHVGRSRSLRRTTAVVDNGTGGSSGATMLNEPGEALLNGWGVLADSASTWLDGARLLAVSGSLPPGATADDLASLVRTARAQGIPALVDTSGPALLHAVRAGAALVKPNLEELAAVTGETDPWRAVQLLTAEAPACTVVASLGAGGLLAATPSGWFQARGPTVVGNPTGAGDAAAACLAAGLVADVPWPTLLRHVVAWSGSSVAAPLAGQVDPAVHARLLPLVEVSPAAAPAPVVSRHSPEVL